MLASFVVYLQPIENTFLDLNMGPLIHALFLSLVAENNPELASQLHADTPVKPFTVSPLQGKFARTGKHLVPLKENTYWLRFTSLTTPVFTTLNKALLTRLARHEPVIIANAKFEIVKVEMEPSQNNPWAGITSFQEIYEQATNTTDITLLFHSPTTFRHKDMNVPLPLPTMVFNGYLQKWNAFSPLPLNKNLIGWIEANVAVEAHRLQTKMTLFTDFQLTGFTGTCHFRAIRKDVPFLNALNALADFAFYSGTGAKTTMGMGQTRRLS